MSLKNHETLLKATRTIRKHQQDLAKAKGETFNIYSILRMETKENDTHSNFIGELLNPKGSHLLGARLLQLFLETINCHHINPATTKLTIEKHVGARNDKLKEGGRIDIFLKDDKGNMLSIENKIHAGDQYAQIERYCNYFTAKNKVYYLNLDGKQPSPESKGDKVEGEDFFIISYKNEIIDWLQLCIKEAAEIPILRESIKQYLILIKKLTHTMDKQHEEELNHLILDNYAEAVQIEANVKKARYDFNETIRQELRLKLIEQLPKHFEVFGGRRASDKYSQIWIEIKGQPKDALKFGIESFSGDGHREGNLFIGVINITQVRSAYSDMEVNKDFHQWINVYDFPDFEGYKSNLGNARTIQKLHKDSNFRNRFISFLLKEIEKYLEEQYPPLIQFLNKESK